VQRNARRRRVALRGSAARTATALRAAENLARERADVSPRESAPTGEVDSPYAWFRLGVSVLLCTIGGVAMWSVVVALPSVQTEFGVARGAAALPYTLTMICTGIGNIVVGRLLDRVGIVLPLRIASVMLCLGYVAASLSQSLTQFALASGLLMALFGCSVTFGPLMADVSMWFVRRRGAAVSICAAGSYLSGTIWPPVVQHFIATYGWRPTHAGIGVFCLLTILPLSWFLRRRPVTGPTTARAASGVRTGAGIPGLPPTALMVLLCVAGVSCCVAMAMPQVHLVAYCSDLGYGPARGAQMLSVMLLFGIVSRVGSGFIADRIGGLRTLLLGSVAQMTALVLYLGFDGLFSLYVVSALFGLFQGGIVPSYALIVREFFPAREAGARIGLVLTSTIGGMALGGWLSGVIFDLTGSYQAAFVNGIGWNVLNVGIAVLLLARASGRRLATA
jgi:MFS family permease